MHIMNFEMYTVLKIVILLSILYVSWYIGRHFAALCAHDLE